MMTHEEIDTLQEEDVRRTISDHITDDPTRIALSVKSHGALISTQIKYLQRAKTKLPSYYNAHCIIPPLAFEQCSSEETAATKVFSGKTCIDLTCGLGVDTLALSRQFEKVIAVERNPILARITALNFARLGVTNVELTNDSAENVIARQTEPVDLIYADPARRSETGNKLFLLEDCSPNMICMMPRLREIAGQIVIKCSPLFDIDEGFRIFGNDTLVEVVSSHGECKEVVLHVAGSQQPEHAGKIKTTVTGSGSIYFDRKIAPKTDREGLDQTKNHPLEPNPNKDPIWSENQGPEPKPDKVADQSTSPFAGETFSAPYNYLLIPDVVFYKARLLKTYMWPRGAYVPSATGYCFSDQIPESFLGKAYRIKEIHPFQPKRLKVGFKQQGIKRINILKKDFPQNAEAIAKALDLKQGGDRFVAFTQIQKMLYTLFLEVV